MTGKTSQETKKTEQETRPIQNKKQTKHDQRKRQSKQATSKRQIAPEGEGIQATQSNMMQKCTKQQ